MIGENGVLTEEFTEALPELLGDNYYNDPDTKQQPTKMFENIKDIKSLVNMAASAQRQVSAGDARFEEKLKGMVSIPGEEATQEEITAYNTAMGVPESADKYELDTLADDDPDKAGFDSIASVVKAAALKGGIPQKALEIVWTDVVTALKKQTQAIEDKGAELIATEDKALRAKLKDGYDAFIKAGDDTLTKLKTGDAFAKMTKDLGLDNHPAVRSLLAEIAPLVAERPAIIGAGGGGSNKDDDWPADYDYDDQGRPKKK